MYTSKLKIKTFSVNAWRSLCWWPDLWDWSLLHWLLLSTLKMNLKSFTTAPEVCETIKDEILTKHCCYSKHTSAIDCNQSPGETRLQSDLLRVRRDSLKRCCYLHNRSVA